MVSISWHIVLRLILIFIFCWVRTYTLTQSVALSTTNLFRRSVRYATHRCIASTPTPV